MPKQYVIAAAVAAVVVAAVIIIRRREKKAGFQPDSFMWPGEGVDVTADAFPYGNYSGVFPNYPQL